MDQRRIEMLEFKAQKSTRNQIEIKLNQIPRNQPPKITIGFTESLSERGELNGV